MATADQPMGVDRLGHVAIRVENVDRAVAFYTDLGMRLVWSADDWCYLEAGEGRDGLALLGPDYNCLLYTSPSPRDRTRSRMPSSA